MYYYSNVCVHYLNVLSTCLYTSLNTSTPYGYNSPVLIHIYISKIHTHLKYIFELFVLLSLIIRYTQSYLEVVCTEIIITNLLIITQLEF